MSVAQSQSNHTWQPSPLFCDGRKFSEVEQAVLWTLLQQEPHGLRGLCLGLRWQSLLPPGQSRLPGWTGFSRTVSDTPPAGSQPAVAPFP